MDVRQDVKHNDVSANYWESPPKSRRPSSKSCDNVIKGVKDDLIVVNYHSSAF